MRLRAFSRVFGSWRTAHCRDAGSGSKAACQPRGTGFIAEWATPADWEPAKRRQKDTDATWTKKHGKTYFGYKLSVNADRRYKLIRKLENDTARVHDGQHFKAVFD